MHAPSTEDSRLVDAPKEHLGGTLGVLQIAMIVIAFSAPLAVVSGYLAVVIALGNGLGAPISFLATGAVLLLFAIGFTELVKAVPACGGFYVYITAGLGRPLGLAGTLVAVLSYFLLAAGTYAFLGLAASRFVHLQLHGPEIPWWMFVGVAWIASAALSYRELDTSAKVVTVSIILEFMLMLSFDFYVGGTGGPEGYSLAPFAASNILSGAPGIALLFAMGMFFGFESTAVYRDEARNPKKTIPRATFLTVGFMTVFYASTTYLLITALGASKAVGIAAHDPAGTFAAALNSQLGRFPTDLGYLLLCTSLYGAVLSMHNVLSRYVFRLATTGLITSRLGHRHPKYKAPSRAAFATSLVLLLFMLPFAFLGTSPDLLYARLVGVGTFGIILLLFLTSIAVITYFARSRTPLGLARTTIAPAIAAICLFSIFVLANRNFVDLVGTSAAVAVGVLVSVYAVVAAGVLWALWLRARRPSIYANIGQG
jgi:amino acid transporter